MKRIFILLSLTLAGATASFAQDAQTVAAQAAAAISAAEDVPVAEPKPIYWTKSVLTNINFGQTSLTNWAAGGYNSVTLAGNIDANANYAKDKTIWTNRLQLDYGFLYSQDKPIMQKNKDRIYFESKWGYQTPVKHLSYSAFLDFKTQFNNNYTYGTPGIDDPTRQDWLDARTLKSGLLSPGYINVGLGLLWTPKPWFSLNVAPITGGFVIVTNDATVNGTDHFLRKTYGMDAITDSDGNITGYKASRFELGAQVKADAQWVINDNFSYTTQLVLFSNYLKNPQNLRVNWDNKVFWKLAKYFALTLSTNLIYDDTITIVNDKHPNGFRAVQFKEFLEFGFTYTIASKK